MSVAALSEQFAKVLKLAPSNEQVIEDIKLDKYPELQQAQIRQWVTLSGRFPDTFGDLNDALRASTYLLGSQEPTAIDSVVLARAEPFVRKWSSDEIVANRHVVRWVDLVQNVLNLSDKVPVDVSKEAPREIKKKPVKETKGEAQPKPKAEAKAKDAKAEPKETKEAAAGKEAKPEGKEAGKEAKEAKTEKKEKAKKAKAPPAPARAVSPGMINLRVGFIQKAVKHPDADSLYVSTIDVGEDEPRTICSGLVNYVPIEKMQQRHVVVFANLKPVKMRGVVSNGMVLCASNKDDGVVEFVNPPADSKAGDRLHFQGFDEEPEAVLNPKKKIFEQIQPKLSSTKDFEIIYKDDAGEHKLVNEKGEVLKCSTLVDANVS